MSAQPSEPPPGYGDLDRRLTAVEGYEKHVLPYEIAATRGAVGLVHDEVRSAIREVTRNGQRLDQVAAEVSDVARAQIEHGAALAQVAGKVDDQGRMLEAQGMVLALHTEALAEARAAQGRHGEMLAGHGEMLAGQAETLAGHGEMLAEILRRLPE